ncbi:MAG: SDR family oxidoreductase [Smithellaceae bacterium]|nr:SDR family oxidoreductase [Smithellaceae bacterium]
MSGTCFEGKAVVITGGSRGIGLELARELLGQGARVAICGRKKEGLGKAEAELAGGDRLLAIPAHVAREEEVEKLFNETLGRFGRLDVLINNVGMNLFTPSLADTELAAWNKILEANLTGAFLCSRQAARIMRPQNAGKILNISSLAAAKASPGMGVYGIAKAGLEMLTRVLAAELAPYNIQVNAVAPGVVRTDFSRPFWSDEALCREIVKSVPAGRIAEISDVVPLSLFLCSGQSNYITGQTVMIDGGATAI